MKLNFPLYNSPSFFSKPPLFQFLKGISSRKNPPIFGGFPPQKILALPLSIAATISFCRLTDNLHALARPLGEQLGYAAGGTEKGQSFKQ